MAAADYYLCDVCGGKAFYDVNLNYDWDSFDEETERYKLDYVGDMKVICTECAKTNTIEIREKA